ncbi:U4/U6 small nuclear ribonucleoprotein Prp3 [Smittium mucronatum]|uniref:U4/U6 small nuclear ribonucleoprotein Prp3 n=1 Tax=Smittium mucronatum TaxID=133383 RepID=A0A1R0GQ84_9FUNG|nr:U4/U6 small nuclear ribonucleoprotein Prp3 [Smittium mucronatum]
MVKTTPITPNVALNTTSLVPNTNPLPNPNLLTSSFNKPTAGTGVFSNGIRTDLIQAQIAAVKAKAQIQLQKYKALGTINNVSQPQNPASAVELTPQTTDPSRGGLNAELHPMLKRNLSSSSGSLFQKSKKQRNLAPMPKFSTIKANQSKGTLEPSSHIPKDVFPLLKQVKKSSALENNPYLEHINNPYAEGKPNESSHFENLDLPSPRHKIHKRKGFNFAKKGTFVKIGERIRAELRLEEMKKKIADGVKKAGLSSVVELQENEISNLVMPNPPEVEWWDAPLLAQPNYKDLFSLITSPEVGVSASGNPIIPVITHYIQHPIPIQAPNDNKDKSIEKPKTVFLTKKEIKKMRRQRRQEQLKDKQEKIRMGLLEPEAPKLKLSNIMRASGMQAIQDPTKMEAIAKKQMAQRLQQHLKSNQERKLTKEEIHSKLDKKKKLDVAINGIFTSVYKVKNLDNGKLRYKININAQQLGLTGVLIIYPRFCLVVVEGGSKAIQSYKKLMLRRMNWKEPSLYVDETKTGNGLSDSFVPESGGDTQPSSNAGPDEPGKTFNYENNSCVMVWEGQVAQNNFKAFKVRVCPSEKIAKEWLARADVESYWDSALNYIEN